MGKEPGLSTVDFKAELGKGEKNILLLKQKRIIVP